MKDYDRREFFRINHQVAIQITPIASLEQADKVDERSEDRFSLLCEIQAQLKDDLHMIRNLNSGSHAINRCLEQTNKTLLQLSKCLMSQEADMNTLHFQTISLSEGGVMLSYHSPLKKGQLVKVKLLFPDTNSGLSANGQVMRSEKLVDNRYEIAISFVDLPEFSRDQLARQIFNEQRNQSNAKIVG